MSDLSVPLQPFQHDKGKMIYPISCSSSEMSARMRKTTSRVTVASTQLLKSGFMVLCCFSQSLPVQISEVKVRAGSPGSKSILACARQASPHPTPP